MWYGILIPTSHLVTLLCLGSGLGAARLGRDHALDGPARHLGRSLLRPAGRGCAGAIRLIARRAAERWGGPRSFVIAAQSGRWGGRNRGRKTHIAESGAE